MPRRARPSLGRAGLGFHSFVPSPLSGRRSFSATSSRARCPPNLSKRERILHSSHEKHFLFGSRHPVNCPSSSSLCRASSTHCGFPLNGIPQEVSPNRLLSQELELPLDCSPCSPTAPTSFSPTPSTSFFLSFSHSASFLRSHSTYRPRSLASPSITSRSITSSSARICRPMKGNSSQTFFSSSLYPSVSSSRIPHRRSLVDTSLFTPCCRHNRYISATISCASLPLSRSRRRPISFLAVPLFSTCTVGGQRSFFSFSLSSLLATTDTSKIGQETPSNSVPQKKPAGSSEAAESGAIVMNSSDTEDTTVDLRRSSPSVHTPETAPEDSQGLPARDSAVVVEEKERDLSHATKEDRNEAPKIEENGQGKNHLEEYFLSPSGYDGPGDGSYRSALLQRIKEATADWASEGRMNSFVSDALASYKATVDLPWSVALPLLGCCLRIVTLPFAISAERDLRVRGLYGGELLERFKAAEEAKKKHGLGSPEWVKTQGKLKSFCKAHDLSVVPLSSLQLLFIAILVGCTSTALKYGHQ
ncbi:60 kda inner membrane protein [Cystoisospora suis]|uniref:60 kDa inner membrane protein n=1 Tax=Cystoisospora suis TaxID=483139 RepID=A0A2C6LH06_9APIC|nr:60 kda inner membrane protein [Cystoisospora suis]